MSLEDGRYWITYNGELYNYRELRGELEADGVKFRTATDTEVLLAMFARHGSAMLSRLNGIFALGIWDVERQSLFLARDRLGVKPLYWAKRNGVFYFASEAKALLTAIPARMRTDKLATYLTLLWVPDPDTLFEGIYKLPAGHYATFADEQLNVEQYWDLQFSVEDRSTEQWSAAVRDEVDKSVRRQMVSDVPLGAFLSGGIDSSAVVASMCAINGRVTAYTLGFSPEDLKYDIVPDDLRYARTVARDLDVDYHERTLEPSVADLLPKLIWHMDEPVADPAAIATYVVCAAAREKLTVILSGMGGDEIFAGYPRYLAAQIGRVADAFPHSLRATLRSKLAPRLTLGPPGRLRGPRRNLMKLMRGIDGSPLERYFVYSSYYQPSELARLLKPEVLDGSDHPFSRHWAYAESVRDEHWLTQLLYIDTKTFLPSLNLAYTDKMSMAASTEVRVPLLDDELVGLASRIPPELKLHLMTRKYILKRSQNGTLPQGVIRRPKAGFGAPVRSWLVNDLKPMLDDLLSPESVRARGIFEQTEVKRLIEANTDGSEDNALRLWALLTLELWQRTYIDS